MTRKTRLVAALALAAGLTAAVAAVAQTQTGSAAPPAASAQPAPPPAQSTPLRAQSEAPVFQPFDPMAGQPTYSQDAPPDSSSGIYLPAVILGYARSATACVVIGCADGPRVGGAEPSSSAADAPLPVTPGPFSPH